MVEKIRKEFKIMKKLKELLKESYVWERKFGEKLPTLADVQKNKLNEVGASAEFKKYQKRIMKDLDSLIDSTAEMKILLKRMGGDKEAKEFGSIMVTGISKIHNYMKTKFVRMIRKLI